MLIRFLTGLSTMVLIATSVHARHVELWSYEKLSKRADVVVVATAISTDAWDEASEEEPQMGGVVFAGQLTKFEVKGVLKGKVTDQRLDLVHYRATHVGTRLTSGVKVIHAHAYTAEFHTVQKPSKPGRTRDDGPPHYLLFLTAREDGKFEPVSGQVDSACSVMILTPEGPAHWHREPIGETFPK